MALLNEPYTTEQMLKVGELINSSEARNSGPDRNLEVELSGMTVKEIRTVQLTAQRAKDEADFVRNTAHRRAGRVIEACEGVLNGSRP